MVEREVGIHQAPALGKVVSMGGLTTSLSRDGSFLWCAGIESSSLPHLNVDQFEWTQHNRRWREDIRLMSGELGLKTLRYAVPWHYIEKERGSHDWSIPDERLQFCRDQGLEVILDVMHFGTPPWLAQAVGDPEFPEALEAFTEAMVSRYRNAIRLWCPVNEPQVTSLFSGDFGFWPPHSRKLAGYFPVLSRMAQATSRAIRAIRRVHPDATVILCETADHFQSADEELRPEVTLRNTRRFLLLDLVMGRVGEKHALYDWARSYGMQDLDLEWFRTHPQAPDVIGLDYYSHSDWALEKNARGGLRQRLAETPAGLYGVANDFYDRFGLPMMVTETSIDGKPINREIWLDRMVEDSRTLRAEGIPLLGLTWWPLFDHMDWDGALTHRIGKLHEVGLFKLVRREDGSLERIRTGIAGRFADYAARGNESVGELDAVALPLKSMAEEGDRIRVERQAPAVLTLVPPAAAAPTAAEVPVPGQGVPQARSASSADYGIVVFSHLRWGFVWQRPQQFLSRFARRHPILFVEEPFFDGAAGSEPRMDLHQVMPNLTVAAPHVPESWAANPELPDLLRRQATDAIRRMNTNGRFDLPLLWYYNPMDAVWSLGQIEARGIVYDCMDELSQFSGASEHLVNVERWLMNHSDVIFTGGYTLWERKTRHHDNVHFFGCGVEADHFGQAMQESTVIPPDIDFLARPILGWFGVIDERVDVHLLGELARQRPGWSFAMVGPVVKVDPNLLPHAPNLYWMGGRDYQVLPNYCKAFDVCLMAFARNEATEYINPTKALEYLATGRPVISTPIQDVVRQYSDIMDIVSTPDEFIAAAERALASPDKERIARGLARVRECTWDATVLKMQALINEGIRRENRRSAMKIQPLPEVRLKYQYARTPGS